MSKIIDFLSEGDYAIWIIGSVEFAEFCHYMNNIWEQLDKEEPYIHEDEFNALIGIMGDPAYENVIFYNGEMMTPKEFTAKVPLVRWNYYKEVSDDALRNSN